MAILLVNHRQPKTAQKIRAIFQASYTIEAELLKAVDFPPLKRKLSDFLVCSNTFYGFTIKNKITAVIEIKNNTAAVHIQSLVVHPKFFRSGIAKKLMNHILETYETKLFTVETGVLNYPAVQLYEQLDFIETKKWNTNHGVRKVRFEKRIY